MTRLRAKLAGEVAGDILDAYRAAAAGLLVDAESAYSAAVPGLEQSAEATISARTRLPGPGEPGFDPWCLTDPNTRSRWQRDPQAQRAIDYATDAQGRLVGNCHCCPWSAI